MPDNQTTANIMQNVVSETNGNILEEYKEAGNNMRHFSNMRVAVLTISLAINGVLLEKLANNKEDVLKFSVFILGIISTLVFFVFESRVTTYYHHYQDRAKELEKILNFAQYLKKPPIARINATFVTKLLYLSFIIIWILLLVKEIC